MTLHLRSGAGGKGTGQYDELGANQLQFTIRLWLIDQGLRFRGVELAVAKESLAIQQTGIDIVDAHRTVVGAADAAEYRSESSSVGDVLVLLCGIANDLNEFVLISLPDWLHFLLSQTKRGKCQERNQQQGYTRSEKHCVFHVLTLLRF